MSAGTLQLYSTFDPVIVSNTKNAIHIVIIYEYYEYTDHIVKSASTMHVFFTRTKR